MTARTDADATGYCVVAGRKDRMLELKSQRLRIARFRTMASAVSSQNQLDAVGSADAAVRRTRIAVIDARRRAGDGPFRPDTV